MICLPGFHIEEICVPDVVPTWQDLGAVPAIAASPTATARKIVQLHPFNGNLYIGYGDWNNTIQPGCDLIYWDGAAYQTVTHVRTDALWSLRTLGNELWALTTDPEVGADPDVTIVAADGSFRFIQGGLSMYPWHLFDACLFNGKPYVAGAYRTQTSDPGGAEGDWGAVWTTGKRADGATIWPFAYTYKSIYRAHAVFVIGQTIWAALYGGTTVSSTDGMTWNASPIRLAAITTKPLAYQGGVVYRSGWPGSGSGTLYSFDGITDSSLGPVRDHFVDDAGALWTILTDGSVSKDGAIVATAPANAVSLAVMDGAVFVGTADSHVWMYQWQ